MNHWSRTARLAAPHPASRGLLAALALFAAGAVPAQEAGYPGAAGAALQVSPDASGTIATVDVNGGVNESGAFFQSLGSNGRSCATCHVAGQAMSISAAAARERFLETRGRDPLFAAIDGARATLRIIVCCSATG
jgi:cytochrome c peroxidase